MNQKSNDMLKIQLKERYKTSRSSLYPYFESVVHETLYFSSEESYLLWKNQLHFDIPEMDFEPANEGFYIVKNEIMVDNGHASIASSLIGFRTGVY